VTEVKQKIQMVDRDIATRLDNWGLCQRGKGGGSMSTRETRRTSPYGGSGYKCMTNVICNLMREAAHGPKGGAAAQSKLDFEDAATINRAWSELAPRFRLLLRDLYALGRPVNVICRELNIKHWPASHWKRELLAAHDAVERIVSGAPKDSSTSAQAHN
jgi:hypothetical protein